MSETKKNKGLHDEGELLKCLTDASDRESNVNALCGKSPGFSDYCSPSHPKKSE
jgi:hypothetical protein